MKLAIPALSLSLILSLAGSARALVWSDDFNDGIVNPSLWTLSTSGGVSAKEENGRFWMHLPSDATGSTFAANLTAQPKLVGDFEILMDFSLDQWSSSSGVRLGLVVQFQYGGIGLVRYNNGPGSAEMYAMDFGLGLLLVLLAGMLVWRLIDLFKSKGRWTEEQSQELSQEVIP